MHTFICHNECILLSSSDTPLDGDKNNKPGQETMRRALIASAAGLCATVAISLLPGHTARAADSTSIAVPANALIFAPLYIAADTGLWAAKDLDVKLPLIAGPGATNAVIAGSADFASTGGGSVLRAATQGQVLLAIANTIDKLLLEMAVSPAAIQKFKLDPKADFATRVKSLKGMTIGVDTVNGLPHGYLRYITKKVGMNPETDVVVTPMQPPSMMAALKAGSIDGFIFADPFTTLAVKDGASILIRNPHDDAPELNPFGTNLIVTRHAVCKEKPTVCTRLVAGLKEAQTKMREQPEAMLAVLKARFAQIPPDILESSYKLVVASSTPNLAVTEQAMQNTQNYAISAGMFPAAEKIEPLSKLYTQDFAR